MSTPQEWTAPDPEAGPAPGIEFASPGGRLVDRWGPVPVMAVGWGVASLCFFAFAFDDGGWCGKVLFVAYGVHYGLAEAAARTLSSRYARTDATGSALGSSARRSAIRLAPSSGLMVP